MLERVSKVHFFKFMRAYIFMTEYRSRQQPAVNPGRERLWASLGNRIRLRREQIQLTAWDAACELGADIQTYADYERGVRLIPADRLATLARLFKVPVFYFFEDLQAVDPTASVDPGARDGTEYMVATQTERIASLVEDFQRLDFARQQHLLVVARALADDDQG